MSLHVCNSIAWRARPTRFMRCQNIGYLCWRVVILLLVLHFDSSKIQIQQSVTENLYKIMNESASTSASCSYISNEDTIWPVHGNLIFCIASQMMIIYAQQFSRGPIDEIREIRFWYHTQISSSAPYEWLRTYIYTILYLQLGGWRGIATECGHDCDCRKW